MSVSGSVVRRTVAVVAALTMAAAAAGCGTARGPSSDSPLQGIDDDSVKVGFTIVDLSSLDLGFKKADYGGVETQTKAIRAIVDHVNANGGLGGRRLEPVIRTYVGANDSPELSQAQCSAYTQDEKVFAVVMDGQLQTNGVPCYVDARTILVDETLIAHDTEQFERNAPYLWSPTHPEYSGFVRAELQTMADSGFFDDASGVLLMPADTEVSRRVTERVVKPFLARLGVQRTQVSYVDSTNVATLGVTSKAAVVTGRSAGLDRVMVIGGARIEPIALALEDANGYVSRWGISTFDNPQFNELNPDYVNTPLLTGQVGLGYDPFQDVALDRPPPLPDPANPAQVLCHSIITEAGATPPPGLRQNWAPVMQYCDGAMFLKAVMDQAPRGRAITGDEFATAAGLIGGTYRSSSTLGSSWGPGVFAGTDAGRRIAWSGDCSCYRYEGDLVRFGPGSGSLPLPTITVTPAGPG